jgi:hypothetical protein
MGRIRKVVAGAMALVLSSTVASQALTPLDTVEDWTCSPESDRLVVASILAQIAGQGRRDLQETFFVSCIEEAARGPASLHALKISNIAAGCVYMALTTFSESG